MHDPKEICHFSCLLRSCRGLLEYFHLADNLHLDKEDKFAKLRPILTKFDKKCQENFVAEQEVSIDEAMVPYY